MGNSRVKKKKMETEEKRKSNRKLKIKTPET